MNINQSWLRYRSSPFQILRFGNKLSNRFLCGRIPSSDLANWATYQALTYRAGHHSTSDDSTKYRPVHEIEHWRTQRDPVTRFRKWIEGNGWWSNSTESEFRTDIRKKVLFPDFKQGHNISTDLSSRQIDWLLLFQTLHSIQEAEKSKKPALRDLFSDVYHETPTNLHEQERSLRETIARHPQEYPSDVPL